MDQNRGGNWFSKSTRLENVGPLRLMFRVMQGGVKGKTQTLRAIRPGSDLEVFGSDIYRNHSTENPVSVYVHLVRAGLDQSQYWTPLDRTLFQNARIRLAGRSNSIERPIEFEPFRGSTIGRLRVVGKLKKMMNKIWGSKN